MLPDWHENGNGNLVADKGDNAKTLGEYLNTTTEIATKIIGASGLSTNEQGNVEEGATVSLGYITYPASISSDLGFLGNQIRDRAQDLISVKRCLLVIGTEMEIIIWEYYALLLF